MLESEAVITSPLLENDLLQSEDAAVHIVHHIRIDPENQVHIIESEKPYDGTATGQETIIEYAMHIEEDQGTCSTLQTAFNSGNILCGVGLLTVPFAMANSGFSSIVLLLLIGMAACYTGCLLARCMEADKRIKTYPDIGQAAFGTWGRVLVSVLLYMELFACCVDFVILEGDNLSAVFPHARLAVGGLQLNAQQSMVLLAALIILPTVWLRDLSLLSYISVGGLVASLALLALVAWEGVSFTGFTHTAVPLVVWRGVPTALGLYSFCFSGHAVFPSVYNSMRVKSDFGPMLLSVFAFSVVLYGAMALTGCLMFGETVSQNITLSMQRFRPDALPSLIATWLVIINPMTKLALALAPVAMALEELVQSPTGSRRFLAASVGIRTALLGGTVLVALAVPFFAYVMSFIGAFLSMTLSIVLPCVFYLHMCRDRLTPRDLAACATVVVLGTVAGACATYTSVRAILDAYPAH